MSTNFSNEGYSASDWISQAEAARLHGVTRQAINKLVRSGRLRSLMIGGHLLVSREDVEGFRPQSPGRPTVHDTRAYERIRSMLEVCDQATRLKVYEYLNVNSERRPHPIEVRLGASAEVILEALGRAGELTTRMFRGIIAEAAFDVHVIKATPKWRTEPLTGNLPFDYEVGDEVGSVRVQVKLQRSTRGSPINRSGYFIVETQRTRGGLRRAEKGTDERTRPYRFGEFDILAVCLQPSTARWDDFRYTVGNWLQPHEDDPKSIATLQPVAQHPNADWSDDFERCVEWFRGGKRRRIGGQIRGRITRSDIPPPTNPGQ